RSPAPSRAACRSRRRSARSSDAPAGRPLRGSPAVPTASPVRPIVIGRVRIPQVPRPGRPQDIRTVIVLALRSFVTFRAVKDPSVAETVQALVQLPMGQVLTERPLPEQEVQGGDQDQTTESGATGIHALPGDDARLCEPPDRRLGPTEK